MYNDYYSVPQEGWKCPSCGRVYAPWVTECRVCGNTTTITGSSYTFTSKNIDYDMLSDNSLTQEVIDFYLKYKEKANE